MKLRNLSMLAFVLVSALFLSGGCVDLKAPEMKFAGIRVLSADMQGADLEIQIEATNTNPIQVGIDRYDAKLFINNVEVLSQSGGGITLEANEKKTFPVKAHIKFENILGTTAAVFPELIKGKMTLDYRVEGTLAARAMGIPFTSPINSSGKFSVTLSGLSPLDTLP